MGLLSFLGLGKGSIRNALQNGALIIDVRTANEYDQGRVPESINIPVDRIPVNIRRILDIKRPIIFCCSTGARSSQAVALLKEKGKKDVYNGGSWMKVLKLVNG